MGGTASPEVAWRRPLRVFISYAHEDEELREKFVKALSQLQRDGLIEGWDDRRIAPGTEWAGVIDERLKTADIVVLLVSNDFLASKYCNEVELETALERHKSGEARVVPVILRPCDWRSARFGRLQALPQDGKPVIDWKTPDHGFLNVVQGLRSIAKEVQGSETKAAEEQSQPAIIAKVRPRWPILVAVGALVAVMAVSWFSWMGHTRARKAAEYVAQGDALMDQRNWKAAEDAYRRGKQSDPGAPEPYARLGYLYDLKRDPAEAAKMYESAVKLSPSSTEYKNNLADQYFKLGEYKRAADTYGSISRFPLAALESAKINRLRNNLDEAEEENRTAVKWLNDGSISDLPENKLPWYFVAENKSIWMKTANEKLCYAQFELSLTLHLKGRDGEAKKYADAGRQSCGERLRDIQAELKREIERLGNERAEFAERAQSYLSAFLGSASEN